MPPTKGRPIYLVSGDSNIRPSDENIRKTGRRVRFDREVNIRAAVELKPGGRFVVVAHGRSDGTIMWFRSDRGTADRWLWVGMTKPPRAVRLYLYACHAGKQLPRQLKHCECFGHVDKVPTPTDGQKHRVLEFLDEVDRLVRDPTLTVEDWRLQLRKFVDDAVVKETENPTDWRDALTLQYLRRSLGYADD